MPKIRPNEIETIKIKKWKVESDSDSEKTYTVSYQESNINPDTWSCTCPHGVTRPYSFIKCKHINFIKNNGSY